MAYPKQFIPLTDSTKRQLEEAEKSIHYELDGSFEGIYKDLFKGSKAMDNPDADYDSDYSHLLSVLANRIDDQTEIQINDVRQMEIVIEQVCKDPDFRRQIKSTPLATLTSLGIILPLESSAKLENGDSSDPNFLIRAAAAQQTVDDQLSRPPPEQLAPGTGIAIAITVLASGVAVAVVTIIRRRRRRNTSQVPNTTLGTPDDNRNNSSDDNTEDKY